jgi:hypothetical protein
MVMENRQERRALPTGGDVAATKIGHHGDAGHFSQGVRIADLPGEWSRQIRTMAQRLAVAADGGDAAGADTGVAR